MNQLKVTHSAFPDGSVLIYADGMEKPQLECMAALIKQSLFNATEAKRNPFKKNKVREYDGQQHALDQARLLVTDKMEGGRKS